MNENVTNSLRSPDWDPTVTPAVRGLADELLPVFYAELKRVARRERARVGGGITLQTTALVHEAYLKLRNTPGWNDDRHFVRAAALAMRHALVNHALARRTEKRGQDAEHVEFDEFAIDPGADDKWVLAVNEALHQLAQQSLRLAQVVECRYFGGYDEAETALALGISERTVRRDWTLARAWLQRELRA